MTGLYRRLSAAFGPEVPGLLGFLVLVLVVFGVFAPNFLTGANFGSI
ncbi:MAG: ABC transporter permease, partial [Rhodobacter sp.]|nr:ABC transporter permease [Rhodobacter sp.]